jgi:NAD(P)-dependent dehydrogenase (short-subunit alcohol dehydrogenase family)
MSDTALPVVLPQDRYHGIPFFLAGRTAMSQAQAEGINLEGQVAIVTGGGRGIGKAIAGGLARACASVAVIARSPDQLAETVRQITELGSRAISVTADVSDPAAVERMVREVEKSLGSVDLLVNNAGLSGPIGPTWETDPDDWWRCLEVNLRGPMLCSRAVLPGMTARGRGRIVNVASGAGTFAIPYLGAYVTSKTALIRLTEILALEAGANGVRVFAIEPGTVSTTMAEYALESEEGKRWLPWFGEIFKRGEDLPPNHAADLVVLLASGRADALSGRFFTIKDDVVGMATRAGNQGLGDLQTLRLIQRG